MRGESTFLVCLFLLIILTIGTPDLLDALIAFIGRH